MYRRARRDRASRARGPSGLSGPVPAARMSLAAKSPSPRRSPRRPRTHPPSRRRVPPPSSSLQLQRLPSARPCRHRPTAVGRVSDSAPAGAPPSRCSSTGGLSSPQHAATLPLVPYATPPPGSGWKHATFSSSSAEARERTSAMSRARYAPKHGVHGDPQRPPSATSSRSDACRRPYATSTCSPSFGELHGRQAVRRADGARSKPRRTSARSTARRSSYTRSGMGAPGIGFGARDARRAHPPVCARAAVACAPISEHSTACGIANARHAAAEVGRSRRAPARAPPCTAARRPRPPPRSSPPPPPPSPRPPTRLRASGAHPARPRGCRPCVQALWYTTAAAAAASASVAPVPAAAASRAVSDARRAAAAARARRRARALAHDVPDRRRRRRLGRAPLARLGRARVGAHPFRTSVWKSAWS